MDESKLYDQLAEHLDQGVVGAPKSPALIEILRTVSYTHLTLPRVVSSNPTWPSRAPARGQQLGSHR